MNIPLYHSTPGTAAGDAPRFASRTLVIALIRAALSTDDYRFARRLALAWLTSYPGDLEASMLHARSLAFNVDPANVRPSSSISQAISILDSICRTDPEYLEAQEAIVECMKLAGVEPFEDNLGSALALGARLDTHAALPPWGYIVKRARTALLQGKVEMAEYLIHQALLAETTAPLVAAVHLQVEGKREAPEASIRSLSSLYHDRWPACIQFSLTLAHALMDGGEPDKAVSLLHQAAASDVTGSVAKRLWDSDHPYKGLWPENLRMPWPGDLAVPASVAAVFGWNLLPEVAGVSDRGMKMLDISSLLEAEGIPLAADNFWLHLEAASPMQPKSIPGAAEVPTKKTPNLPSAAETLQGVQFELERIAKSIRQPLLARLDGRYPVYVILSTRQGLEDQYTREGADRIQNALRELSSSVSSRKGWDAMLFIADEGYCEISAHGDTPEVKAQPLNLGLKPAKAGDAWNIKLALADLDQALSKRGQMIGALLIAGGPSVVPFHRLPNPVDDFDGDVPSDNPYGTRDENYFIPEWPVGRLTAGCEADPAQFIEMVRLAASRHAQASSPLPWPTRFLHSISRIFPFKRAKVRPGQGYTAAVWKRAAGSVFKPVSEPRHLLVSPPVLSLNGSTPKPANGGVRGPLTNIATKKEAAFKTARLGYFNLHGLPDAVEWYGQSDPTDPFPGADYPVALRPQDISGAKEGGNGSSKALRAPDIVFTEACYGAYINGRKLDESICLKFIACGSQAVVGSTCIAYGSIASPLAAADLLGYAFWESIKAGIPAGEALRRAKIQVAREMHHRQGYLDGEDQKTLVSFILYGDPLAQGEDRCKEARPVFRSMKVPAQVKTVCERTLPGEAENLSPESMTYVKHVVARYLPSMTNAHLAITHPHVSCQGEAHSCPTAQMGAKSRPHTIPYNQVVTLSKQVKTAKSIHNHYARLTLDGHGKLVKLVVSR
jgi:hypothetical protein